MAKKFIRTGLYCSLAVILVLSLAFAGCGSSGGGNGEPAVAAATVSKQGNWSLMFMTMKPKN